MKREDLKSIKVNGTELPDDIIDQIMAANGRDIENAKKPYADYDHIKEQLQAAQEGIKAFEGVDVADLKNQISKLTVDLQSKDTEWQAKLDGITFDNAIKDAITAAHGKNTKAIMALLDLDALRASKDQTADIKDALETCQKENDYLFGNQTPPPYADGTGSKSMGGDKPMTLAGALHERYKT